MVDGGTTHCIIRNSKCLKLYNNITCSQRSFSTAGSSKLYTQAEGTLIKANFYNSDNYIEELPVCYAEQDGTNLISSRILKQLYNISDRSSEGYLLLPNDKRVPIIDVNNSYFIYLDFIMGKKDYNLLLNIKTT